MNWYSLGAYVNGELIYPKTKKDKIMFSMTGKELHKFSDAKTCFTKAVLLSMAHDKQEVGWGDYTKCYLYNRNRMIPDWEEDEEIPLYRSCADVSGANGNFIIFPFGNDIDSLDVFCDFDSTEAKTYLDVDPGKDFVYC